MKAALDRAAVAFAQPEPAVPEGRVLTRERHGIWSVTVDGAFLGDYHHREDAEAAAKRARQRT